MIVDEPVEVFKLDGGLLEGEGEGEVVVLFEEGKEDRVAGLQGFAVKDGQDLAAGG